MSTTDSKAAVEKFLKESSKKTLLRFTTAGSVDDGKSTLIGRLLHDSKSIYEDQILAVKNAKGPAEANQEIDFALITDGLRAEREQGITIDVAYRYFSTAKRSFILADTPGHEQYTRNMATGASTADVALLLIDARKGVLTQTKRHAFIVSLLGVRKLCVAINKIDLVDYSEEVFEQIKDEFTRFSAKLQVSDIRFVPVSALKGDNVISRSPSTPWYTGESILEYLENVYIEGNKNLVDFRFPVQYVIRPHQDFRGYAGEISSGVVRPGDEVMVLPSRRRSKIAAIESFDGKQERAFTPMSVNITLEDELDISRGDMLVHPNNLPKTDKNFEAMVVWMHEEPMDPKRTYIIKHTTRYVRMKVQQVRYKVDVNTLSRETTSGLALNEIGRVVVQSQQPLYWDPYRKNRYTGSIIIIDAISNNTVGAGMIIDRVPGAQLSQKDDPSDGVSRELGRATNITESKGRVSYEERITELGYRPGTIWFTGLSGSGKSTVAIELERRLFELGVNVYRLDGDNIRFGLCNDLGFTQEERKENIRRVAEVARLMNEAGVVVIVSLISPYQDDRERARTIIGPERFSEVYVSTPLDECERRDPKGLYKKARSGEIKNFTGISAPYEPPQNPQLIMDTTGSSLEDEAAQATEMALKFIGFNQVK